MKIKAKDVDEYIASSAKESRPLLKALRAIIKSVFPKVEEGISWNVPFYKHDGPLAGFASYKNHVSFGFAKGTIDADDRAVLEKKGYTTGIRTIQIQHGQTVPAAILKKILKSKGKINEAKKKSK